MSLQPTSLTACTHQVILSLGSNLGDRVEHLSTATRHLHKPPHTQLIALSSLYETKPVDLEEQPCFFNAVGLLETSLAPLALLEECLRIEALLGRTRQIAKGPRTLDIDLILYGCEHSTSPRLTLPHPRYAARAFVCVPLVELFQTPPLATSLPWAFLRKKLSRLPDHLSACSAGCRRLPPTGNFPCFPAS
ncbi:MAG: 2-amino-4-hydroxy-6-hydroxymethyldihydropteridine diphosphokinase [Puniceicoccales bacterium]|jgi:2-amino-4-hydroxy-6-hydroxymethyldihydropteridine diphosphokinase|nr:2-amino-4-hydroxy-6-hydroxymethyldihydropteridine diphosphokinase [Puniceicoccales bacterium]